MPIDALVLGENTFSFHAFSRMRPLFEAALDAPDVDVETTTDRDCLRRLGDVDVVVDYTTDCAFTDAQLDGLVSFVEDGGGYVGVHGAADLTTTADGRRDEPHPALRDLLGGHFETHPERTRFAVSVVDSHHPVTADLPARFSLWDEPYQLDVDADVTVLARMDHPELADMPVVWTRAHGDGNVVYCSLGHDRPAFVHDAVGQLLRNAVRWAADG
ncbi:MAG: ThuA domain-containing protein [Halobacteriaceae archaeon]